MQKKTFYLIQEEELRKINKEIVPLFGQRNRVISGSIYICKGNKTQCNIVVGDTSTYKSKGMLKRIGARVKAIMEANEVYSFGIKLA